MQITTVGLDLAKNVFQVHGVNDHGKGRASQAIARDQVAAFFANLPACLVGMKHARAPITGRASWSRWATLRA